MKCEVYKQSYHNYFVVNVSFEDMLFGYKLIDCPDCDGSGLFQLPDDEMVTCVPCKGAKKIYINLT
jgi:hypothetical protein